MERRSSSTRLFQGERVSKNLSLHVFITSVFVFFFGGVGGGGGGEKPATSRDGRDVADSIGEQLKLCRTRKILVTMKSVAHYGGKPLLQTTSIWIALIM